MDDDAQLDDATREAEEADAGSAHAADRPPTTDEVDAAERSREAFGDESEEVAAHYEEMADLGAHVKGEGAIE